MSEAKRIMIDVHFHPTLEDERQLNLVHTEKFLQVATVFGRSPRQSDHFLLLAYFLATPIRLLTTPQYREKVAHPLGAILSTCGLSFEANDSELKKVTKAAFDTLSLIIFDKWIEEQLSTLHDVIEPLTLNLHSGLHYVRNSEGLLSLTIDSQPLNPLESLAVYNARKYLSATFPMSEVYNRHFSNT